MNNCCFMLIHLQHPDKEAIQLNISGSLTFAGEVVGRLSDLDDPL